MTGPILKYTERLAEIIDNIPGSVAEMLIRIESDPLLDNYLNIETVDISKSDWSFDIKIRQKNGQFSQSVIKVGKFIRYIMPGIFTDKEIYDFGLNYEKLKKGQTIAKAQEKSERVQVPPFKFNPKDVRSTFLSLTTNTYPHGHEEEVMKFMPPGLSRDEFGNYYKIIGKSETMFTSHLDTADRTQRPVTIYSIKRDGDEIFVTDGTSILGADDKAGVTIMLYMMAHNIPGLYYFFIGEERGAIGSKQLSSVFEKVDYLKSIKRCVSFDRRNYYSVITKQIGRVCCSDEFATALCKQLNKSGLQMSIDPTGIFTDSASFIDEISECTNISVGYFKEHMHEEHQNISFLERVSKACLQVDWESLPSVRKVGFDEEILAKYKHFIAEFKTTVFDCQVRLMSEFGIVFIEFEIDEPNIDVVSEDIKNLSILFNKYKMDPDIYFEDQFLKIELS